MFMKALVSFRVGNREGVERNVMIKWVSMKRMQLKLCLIFISDEIKSTGTDTKIHSWLNQ